MTDGRRSIITLTSVAPSILEPTGDVRRFAARQPGYGAIVAHTELGTVTDFVHVKVASIHHLDVHASSPTRPADGRVTTSVGTQHTLRLAAFDESGEPLAGAVSLSWIVDGDAIAVASTDGLVVNVTAVGQGTATLRAAVDVSQNADDDTRASAARFEAVFNVQGP